MSMYQEKSQIIANKILRNNIFLLTKTSETRKNKLINWNTATKTNKKLKGRHFFKTFVKIFSQGIKG